MFSPLVCNEILLENERERKNMFGVFQIVPQLEEMFIFDARLGEVELEVLKFLVDENFGVVEKSDRERSLLRTFRGGD